MKNLMFLLVMIFLLLPASSAWANESPEGMVRIKQGCFMMGTNKIYDYLAFRLDVQDRPNDRERPVHKVCLDSFYLDTHEVTQKKWKQVTKNSNKPLVKEFYYFSVITFACSFFWNWS